MRLQRTLAAAVALTALTGCAGSEPDADPVASTTTGTASPSPAATGTSAPANVRYDSVFDIRERVEDAGITCTDWEVIPTPTNAVERANCTSSLGFAIHTDASQAAASIEGLVEVTVGLLERTSVHLAGPNWTVNCSEDETVCTQLQGRLGGELEVHEP